MFVVEVFVTNASLNVNQLYSYFYDEYIKPYKRVKIIFAFGNTTGLVVNSYQVPDLLKKEEELGFKLSKIISVIDEEPIINESQFNLAKWLSATTVSPFISCLNTMLPKALRTSKKIESQRFIEVIEKQNNTDIKLTARQKEIYDQIKDGMLSSEARKLSSGIFNKLKDLNLIKIKLVEKTYVNHEIVIEEAFKVLTRNQEDVYQKVLTTNKLVSLLFGVTGAGKTEVYLHLARHYLKQNKEVLILVPEISLTPQMIQRVKERFSDVTFYHSELSDQERYEQYKRVKEGEVKIVVGTRSSIFLPFNNLGLIIIDEEHDNSYKQDSTPCYHLRNVAIKIAKDNNAKVLLASATPSLDSYTRAIKGDYEFVKLDKRINNQLPEIEIVDLLNECKNKGNYIISKSLKSEIDNTLSGHNQAIILLNRRGYSPVIKCGECSSTLTCRNCDVALNYHKDENVLKCHTCGKTYKIPQVCPKCGSSNLIYYGFGTKKVQEELQKMFPDAHIERMDRDNVTKKGSHKRILDSFEKREIDILIGTQMIAKGLDYPGVTLVGILNGDAGLMRQDYNCAKLTFDLLMQASGRSGRANQKGKVIIQAFNVDHYVLKAVLAQDYNYFYNIEMNYRHKLAYPPYSHILEIIISDTNENKLNRSTSYIFNLVKDLNFKVYKPINLSKINGLYRSRIMLLNKDMISMINETWKILDVYLKQKNMSKIKVDIDPLFID